MSLPQVVTYPAKLITPGQNIDEEIIVVAEIFPNNCPYGQYFPQQPVPINLAGFFFHPI
jgi:hypothetical protein